MDCLKRSLKKFSRDFNTNDPIEIEIRKEPIWKLKEKIQTIQKGIHSLEDKEDNLSTQLEKLGNGYDDELNSQKMVIKTKLEKIDKKIDGLINDQHYLKTIVDDKEKEFSKEFYNVETHKPEENEELQKHLRGEEKIQKHLRGSLCEKPDW